MPEFSVREIQSSDYALAGSEAAKELESLVGRDDAQEIVREVLEVANEIFDTKPEAPRGKASS